MPPRPLRDKDKYYPGSPWGDRPPQELQQIPGGSQIQAASQVIATSIRGLQGQIVERELPSGTAIHVPRDALKHIDAYFEYRQLVGDSDGGQLLSEAEYEALRERAADPTRRVWAFWVESTSGLECRAIGPNSACFCGHRYREHTWADYPETHELRCKMKGCPCVAFSYVPVRGSGDLRCSACKQSYLDHDRRTRRCLRNGNRSIFASSYSCTCGSSYNAHETRVQTNSEREAAGKSTGAAWMSAASGAGLPTAHMGGIGGFTALADGVDRALAGLEPGFEPQRVHDALASGAHGISGLSSGSRSSSGAGTRARSTPAARALEAEMVSLGGRDRPVGSRPLPLAGRTAAAGGSSNRPPSGRSSRTVPGRGRLGPASAGTPSHLTNSSTVASAADGHDATCMNDKRSVFDWLSAMSPRELRALADFHSVDISGCLERSEVVERLLLAGVEIQ